MSDFTIRLGSLVEFTYANLAHALHKADELAKRHRETYTVWRDGQHVATATPYHTTMEAAP